MGGPPPEGPNKKSKAEDAPLDTDGRGGANDTGVEVVDLLGGG